jgi:hypothetical protein
MSDPKLKEMAAEIRALFKKHDVGGHVVLVSQTHSEFMFVLDPTWSAVIIESDLIRIRAVEEELGSKEAVHKKAELTAHLLSQLRDLSASGFSMADQLIEKMEEIYEIDHES